MAITKLGTLIIGIRGTSGGITFSANGNGPYAKLWSKGPNPHTNLQQTTRGRITTFGALWNGMTQGQRDDWQDFGQAPPEEDYNSLAERIYPSGWNWFCRINQRRLSVGQATSTTLPSDVAVNPPASATLALAQLPGGASTIAWPPATYGATDSALLFLTLHPSSGLAAKKTALMQVLAKYNPGNTGETITTAVQNAFGNIRTDWKGFAFLYVQRVDAVRSTPATTTAIVT
jgi:hypothetical protein